MADIHAAVDGYGPQHAKQLAEAGEHLAINNADNYRWYDSTACCDSARFVTDS